MARKIQYRAVSIDRLTSSVLAASLVGAIKLLVAIDIAKTKIMAGFGREDGSTARLVKFQSPVEMRAFVELVVETGKALSVQVEALMEPTGTYGDALRALLIARGVAVFMLSPKRVHDEVLGKFRGGRDLRRARDVGRRNHSTPSNSPK